MKNIPNILSAFRICLVPVFVILYFTCAVGNTHYAAVIVYAAATLTDILDGYLARRNNWISNLGRILDPLGDKLMALAVITCITVDGRIPLYALLMFAVKEGLMIAGGIVIHKKYKAEMPPSNPLGKLSTVCFFAVCASVLLFPGIPQRAVDIMIIAVLVITFAALGSYIMTYRNLKHELKNTADNK